MHNIFARTIEYNNDVCIIDGVVQSDTSECDTATQVLLTVFIPLIIVSLILLVWWFITLVHVIAHEDVPNRLIWLVLHFVGLGLICAPIYYFAVQRPYNKKHAALKNGNSQEQQTQPKHNDTSVQ